MPKARLTLTHLPPALTEILGRDRRRYGLLFIGLGMVLAPLFVFVASLMINIQLSTAVGILAAFGGALIGAKAASAWSRGSGRSIEPEVLSAAKAAVVGHLPGEALALLEACALHRSRVDSAATNLETKGSQWGEIASDARSAADSALVQALRLCGPFAGQGRGRRGRWVRAFEEVLDGDFDDVLDALSLKPTEIEVNTGDLPSELTPMVKIVDNLKRLASELGDQTAVSTAAMSARSETEEILDRLRHVREAEQELHRDLNA